MKRVLAFTMVLFGFAWSSASAQTTDAGYADALTPSLASVARTMHVTMRRNIVEAAEPRWTLQNRQFVDGQNRQLTDAGQDW